MHSMALQNGCACQAGKHKASAHMHCRIPGIAEKKLE
jgi:hypothetical protein